MMTNFENNYLGCVENTIFVYLKNGIVFLKNKNWFFIWFAMKEDID